MSYINEVHPVDRTSSSSSIGYNPRPGGCSCFLQGSGPPSPQLGQTNDVYLDTDSFTLYAPKSAAGWPVGYSLRGPMGQFLYGLGAPDNAVGNDGDAYLDQTPGSISLYANKANGTWPKALSLMGKMGPVGSTGRDGTRFVFGDGPPPAENDAIGPFDAWVDKQTGTLYPQLSNEV